MKTNFKSRWGNKNQKAAIKSVGIIIGFIFFTSIVDAQDSANAVVERDTLNQTIIAMIDNSVVDFKTTIVNSSTKESTVLDFLQVETEEKLELESWMINEEMFLVKTVQIETVKEDTLDLEAWMTNKQFWKVK